MPTIQPTSTLTSRARSGFTLVEILLVLIAIPVALVALILVNAYVPTLILISFGYDIGLWFFFAVNVAAVAMGFGYTMLGASSSAGKDAPLPKRLGRAAVAYLLHSITLMLIFSATGDGIGLVHLLVAGLPMPIFWQVTGFAVRRLRTNRKADDSSQTTPESTDKN